MNGLVKSALTVVSVGGAVAMVVAAPASAASNKQVFPLTCNGTTYQVTTNGNGDWTPARDNNSNLVFHPTAFGEFTGTFTPADGSPPSTQTDPPFARKTQPRNGHPTADCTFTIHFMDDNGTFDGSGGVTGWTSGNAKH
jgi:hypothetical protein